MADDGGGELQLVMTGQNFPDVQCPNRLDGAVKLLRIRGGIKRVQAALIDQVAGVQVFPLRLVKAAMPRGMPGRVDHLQCAVSQLQAVAAMQKLCRRSMEYPVILRDEIRGERTGFVQEIVFDHLQRNGELHRKPVLFRLMHGKACKVPMSADMIPMGMGSHHGNGQAGQAIHHVFEIGHTQAGVNENGPLRAASK